MITGDQFQRDVRSWLSPPDPSTNHRIFWKARHKGTATWFFKGTMLTDWKSTDSLLWIHGKRTLSLVLAVPLGLMVWVLQLVLVKARFCMSSSDGCILSH
jgi:hypothetical protein